MMKPLRIVPGVVEDSFEKLARRNKTSDPNDGYTARNLYLSKLNANC